MSTTRRRQWLDELLNYGLSKMRVLCALLDVVLDGLAAIVGTARSAQAHVDRSEDGALTAAVGSDNVETVETVHGKLQLRVGLNKQTKLEKNRKRSEHGT